MSIHSLKRLLNPKRIALIGVTINPESVGGKVLANLVGGAFRGVVYPVNPNSESVLGVQCYKNIHSLPRTPDMAIICSPAVNVPEIVRDCGENGIEGVIIMSAGFIETGVDGNALNSQLKKIVAEYPAMRVLGPNCLGIVVPGLKLNASFASIMPKKGNVAFISQSGALCTSVLDWAKEEKIGFSYFVSIGNAIDVDFADLIDYFGEDEKTEYIILYIESISNARKFITATRNFARTKPILVYKAGRFPQSAAVAASHTGAIISEDAVYDSAFRRTGVVRVFNIGEVFDCVELVGRNRIPKGSKLGVVTNAGGPGVMAIDALIDQDGMLAELSSDSIEKLDNCLPPIWSGRNPVDILGDARASRFKQASKILIEDDGVDALLVILTPQGMTKPTRVARAIGELATETRKPILAAWLGRESVREGMKILVDSGIATYSTPEQAVRAFMTLVNYSRNLENLYETPRDFRIEFNAEREAVKSKLISLCTDEDVLLSEKDTKNILSGYGINTTSPIFAQDADQAAEVAEMIGYPVVLKIDSPDITHKTDVGGIILNLANEIDVHSAFRQIICTVAENKPEASIRGVTVQKMVSFRNTAELILGLKKDVVFGTVIMIGVGGIAAEIWKDSSIGFPPLNERLAMRMLESLRIWPLLNGYRGRPSVDLDGLVETMIRFSYIASDNPEIEELDVNPLLCGPEGVIALDARAVIRRVTTQNRPYGHLALRPYPEEFVKAVNLEDGTRILLRPIRPEDEPMWMEMLGSCSRESIYSRFRFFFNWETHNAAVRFCYIDYDREIAIVAEHEEAGNRELLGVGRLVADPSLETVEYAVLVIDEFQNKGLGGILTDYCENITRKWGITRIVAETTTGNPRMIYLFKNRGYNVDSSRGDGVVNVWKDLK